MPKIRCNNCNYLLANITKDVKGTAELKCPICRQTGKYADISTVRENSIKSDIEVTVKMSNNNKKRVYLFRYFKMIRV